MKNFFVLALVCFFYLSSFSQNKKEKKDIKSFKIKSITETVTDYENGKETSTRKDSYFAYDKDANILVNEEYRKDGTLKHKETNKYDGKGNKTEEVVFDAAESTPKVEKNIRCVCKFDMDDNKTEELEYDADGKLIKKVVYSYDSKGLKVEKKEYDGANNLLSSRKYQYQF